MTVKIIEDDKDGDDDKAEQEKNYDIYGRNNNRGHGNDYIIMIMLTAAVIIWR